MSESGPDEPARTHPVPTVPWVVGRKKALARVIALEIHRLGDDGPAWERLTQAQKNKRVRDAERVIDRWVANGVLIQMAHEYRDGG